MTAKPLIVGLGGTARPGSTSERLLRLAVDEAEALGCETALFTTEALDLPHYGSSGGAQPRETVFIEALRQCHGVIISSPGYHGTISGMVKNALDYVEALRNDRRAYLTDRAVGCLAVAGGWQAANSTLTTLRAIAHALRGWPTPYGAAINSGNELFDHDGDCIDLAVKDQVTLVARQVVGFARSTANYHPPLYEGA